MIKFSTLAFSFNALFALNVFAQTNPVTPVAPPKSIKELVAQIDAAKPRTERIAELNAILAETAPAGANVRAQIIFLRRQARAAEELGQTGRELTLLRRNFELARGTPDAARVLGDLAFKERLYGDFTASMALVDESIKIAPNVAYLIGSYGAIAVDRAATGDLPGAEAAMSRADHAHSEAMFTLTRGIPAFRHLWRGNLECLRGQYLAARGRWIEAGVAYGKAVESAIEDTKIGVRRFEFMGIDGPPADIGHVLRDNCELAWAESLVFQRRHVAAEVLLRDQIQRVMARVGRDSTQVAGALGALGGIYLHQSRFTDAEALLAESIRIYERIGAEDSSFLVARMRKLYAGVLFTRGAYAEAVAQVERWKGDAAGNPGLGVPYIIALLRSGKAERGLGIAAAYAPLSEARYGKAHLYSGQAIGVQAMALRASGKKPEALTQFRNAVRVMADARARSGGDEGDALNKQIFGAILEDYLSLLSEMQGPEFAAQFPAPAAAEGFSVADLLRAGSVQRALAASAARASTDKALADTVRREQELGEEANTLTRTLPNLLAAPPEKQLTQVIAAMRARIAAIETEQSKLAKEIEQRFPAYANLIAPKAPSLAEAQAALREGEALLSVFIGETRTFVWAVPKSGAPVFHAAATGKREIEALAAKVRRTVDPFSHGLPDVPPFALDEAHEIYRLVVAPVAPGLSGAKQVIVAANGALAALPFSLLPTAKSDARADQGDIFSAYRTVPWMARRHAISQVPSVNALVTLRALPARADKTASFAGVGDPVFSRAQMTDTAQSATGVAVRGGPRIALRSAGRLDQFDSAELARLERLPDTSEEIRSIAAIFGAGSDVMLRAQANEKDIKARDWRNRRVVMFATHGLVPGELNGLDQPALALTSPEIAGGDGDGLLTVEEILNLKLDADWVVLSACNTASGSEAGAEALSGLGRAFFFAGTRALLASNWPVETVSARLITTGIFQRQVKDAALSKSEVLQATLLDLIDNGAAKDAAGKVQYAYAHPLFWAPFALVGDGR